MGGPPALDLDVTRGDDFAHMLAWVEPGGRPVTDLAFTSGSAAVTSATAQFVAGDVGKLVTLLSGAGVADGTTISSVQSGTAATLSANATSTRTNVKATIRGLDMTGYTSWLCQMRSWEDASTVAATFTVDDARAAYGIVTLTLANADSDGLTDGGPWDLQGTTAGGLVHTRYAGAVVLHLDTARA